MSERPFVCSYNFWSFGSFSAHSPHQVAHKLIRITLPPRSVNRHIFPDKSASSNAGRVLLGFCHSPWASPGYFEAARLFHVAHAAGVPPVCFQSVWASSVRSSLNLPCEYCGGSKRVRNDNW